MERDRCEDDEDGYDAVVVGSGYGGSVAAYRLSMAGIKVCLIEKGRRWESKDFPTDSFKILTTVRMENRDLGVSFGPKDALFQAVSYTADMARAQNHRSFSLGLIMSTVYITIYEQDNSLVAMACGLGGGSLVNAGVMVSTPNRVRRNLKWPKEWENDWEVCEASASTMLSSQSVPVEFPNAKVMRLIAEDEIEESFKSSIKLTMNFNSEEASSSSMGSQQMGSCLACGNCLSGCPYNAKNSTDKNYLVSATKAGCIIKTGCQVQYVVRNPYENYEKGDGISEKHRLRWRVYFNEIDYVASDFVIISAGVFGTTKILFQSERRGLEISERLGFGFSCNGNNVAYLAGSTAPLNAYGLEKKQFAKIPFEDRPGPSISSSYTSSLGFTIQSAVLSKSFPYLVFKGISTYGWPVGCWFLHGVIDKLKYMLGVKASQGMVLNAMGYDESDGRITLDKNTNKICFTPPHDPLLPRKIQALQKITKRLGGILFMSRNRSTSVHLLGGCNAASDPSHGVCNPKGQVFNPKSPQTVHQGLYVCDASLIPCSIGINPCLTIVTLAEHVSRQLVQEAMKYKNHIKQVRTCAGKQHSEFVKKVFDSKAEKQDIGSRSVVIVKETMRGYVGGMPCIAYLTMKMNSNDTKDLREQNHGVGEPHSLLRGKVGGYVVFKAVEKDELHIIDGKVDLCKLDNKTPYTQYMNYHLILASASGSRYILEGKKIMNPFLLGCYAWKESTTLHVTLRMIEKNNLTKEMVDLKGELHVSFADLLRCLISLEGNKRARFICLLLQSLLRTYILQTPRGSLKDFSSSDSNKKSYPPSTLHEIKTEDGFMIHCRQWKCNQNPWRCEGGRKQSQILLINGYSTESFWLPTEPKDLIRALLENGYETWLLQPRLNPLHPSNNFTFEDIAKFDIPAAIKKIDEFHGQYVKVHVVAHCVGGLSIHIALMGGHVSTNHIASLCCTNSSMFFKLNAFSLIKMRLPLIPISMRILGKHRVLPMFQTSKTSHPHSLLKSIARLIPRYERCTCDECEVFSGIFGNTFWHDNVSPTMHHWLNKQSLPSLPMSAFTHLRKICTTGFIVDPNNKNTYLIHPERMSLPTLYISGGRSLLVTPQTSFLANQYMKLHQPGYKHTRLVVEGFGHSDLLIGEESYKKVFPHIISHIGLVEEGNGIVDVKESKDNKEALSWCDDPYEERKKGVGSWVSPLVLFWLFMLFLLVLITLLV